MKQKNLFTGFVFLFVLWLFTGSLKAQVSRQVLFSIGDKETAVYGESEIYLENSGTKVSLVTIDNNGKYFLYDKGVRKGPFENSDSIRFKPSENDESLFTSIFNSEGVSNGQDLASTNDEGKPVIRSGVKVFGPFESVLKIWADKNGKFLMAIIGEGTKFSLLSTAGELIQLDGFPYATSISPSGNKIVITVIKEEYAAMDYTDKDYSKMSQEDLLKISREIEEKQKNEKPAEGYIYSNDGKKFGPFPKDALNGGNPFFTKTSGDIWLFLNKTELYVNGYLLAKIPLDFVSTGDVWLSDDGKRFAVIAYDTILFSNGQSYPFPLRTRMVKKGGKTWLNWICLENLKDVVFYSGPL